jgi:hypothetical protein
LSFIFFSSVLYLKTDNLQLKTFPHAGTAPPIVVLGGIGGMNGPDGIPGAITGCNRL